MNELPTTKDCYNSYNQVLLIFSNNIGCSSSDKCENSKELHGLNTVYDD